MISPVYIRDYLVEKFKDEGKLVSDGAELVIPSLFVKGDYKGHMSINLDTGLWQCFKSKERGGFLKLYAMLEEVTYSHAKGEVFYNSYTAQYTPKEEIKKANVKKEAFNFEEFLGSCQPLWEVDHRDVTRLVEDASEFLQNRRLWDTGKYWVCQDGPYKNRLIIPFFLGEKVVFFQARALYDVMHPKYLNFKGMKCSDILYPFDMGAEDLYITEGVFCCKTLRSLGFNATCINGSFVSREQAYQLKQFEGRLIMAMDNDEAGKHCIATFNKTRKDLMMPAFWVVTPDEGSKDWNDQYVMGKPIEMDAKLYDWTFPILTEL